MTDDHDGEARDPLLVRPFVLHDDSTSDDGSGQTWPSATTREVRSQRALEGADDPTAILELPSWAPVLAPTPGRSLARHHVLLLASVGLVVLIGLVTVGYLALSIGAPSVNAAGGPGDPLPAVTGPQITGNPAARSTAATAEPTRNVTTTSTPSPSATAATSPASAEPSGTAQTLARPSSPTAESPTTASTTSGNESALGLGALGTLGTGAIRGQNGLCLGLAGGTGGDDIPVQVASCNGSAEQTWIRGLDGSLRVGDKCALLVGDNTVRTVSCDGRTTAHWQGAGQRLINAASGGCLTDPSSGRQSGTRVSVTGCGGSANQRWSLP